MPVGTAGGTGLSDVPRPNVTFTWPANPPHEKHQPSPTPYQAHAPLHAALERRQRLGSQLIDPLGDGALGLGQARDVGEDRLVARPRPSLNLPGLFLMFDTVTGCEKVDVQS